MHTPHAFPYSEWLPTGAASRRLGVSEVRVRQLVAAGRLRFVTTPLGRLFDPEAIEVLARRRQLAGAGDAGAVA